MSSEKGKLAGEENADPMLFSIEETSDGLFHLITDRDGYFLVVELLKRYACNTYGYDLDNLPIN